MPMRRAELLHWLFLASRPRGQLASVADAPLHSANATLIAALCERRYRCAARSLFIRLSCASRPRGQLASVADAPLHFANATLVAAFCERRCRCAARSLFIRFSCASRPRGQLATVADAPLHFPLLHGLPQLDEQLVRVGHPDQADARVFEIDDHIDGHRKNHGEGEGVQGIEAFPDGHVIAGE